MSELYWVTRLDPINVCHDKYDMPKTNSWILVQQDNGGYATLKILPIDTSGSN